MTTRHQERVNRARGIYGPAAQAKLTTRQVHGPYDMPLLPPAREALDDD